MESNNMHICNSRFGEKLADIEISHLNSCESCQADFALFAKVRANVKVMELKSPPVGMWPNIYNAQATSKKKKASQQKKIMLWQTSATLAVAFCFLALGWLFISNQRLEMKLDELLLANQLLELQLKQNVHPSFSQARLVSQVQEIEGQLLKANSLKE
ncbi:hypothetical protein Q4489_01520 [Thalassotalea sp. 1_MG-2023]|uniref:hypothetical protein n=1 Tax=Thalassotalea sp. 1_MG-2023 TaxID=3062680 RepID=UPI0026E1E831|nr:hypothetical protein [Thalassotalea sp. 1_MG-2023]MDO6425666.1 hypothetical protein [Thalassotalea sp. 1_MG-2023]